MDEEKEVAFKQYLNDMERILKPNSTNNFCKFTITAKDFLIIFQNELQS
jgi:hypothetical protein